jgi:TPR repeat protein
MAPEETASLPCGHRYHCECIKQLRERGVSDTCPQCRARLPPGPEQCFDEAARLLVRAQRMGPCDEKGALAAQAAALLEQVLQEEPGHVGAQYSLGSCFDMRGEFKGAVQWYRKAAEQGHAGSQYNLGVCYQRGEGVRKDAGKAVEWYRKAAAQGHAKAQNNLALCYGRGEGVPKDAEKAAGLLRKTAEQGDTEAQYNLSACYANGKGVPRDMGQAVGWLRKAAEQGHAQAQEVLLGLHLPADTAEEGQRGGGGGASGGCL